MVLGFGLGLNKQPDTNALAAYMIDGNSPVMVSDPANDFYFNTTIKKFAVDHDSTALGNRTVTLSNGLLGWAGHNLFLNSATLVTQGVTTAAADYTIAFKGTGTVTLTGTSTAGPIVGTGVDDLVLLEFTTTAGTLTCTVSGSVTVARIYRSDLAGIQPNDTADPTYYVTGASAYYAPAFDYDPVVVGTDRQMRIEPAATNLLLNSATLSTQGVTVTAVAHTLHFTGTGTITLTGTSTAGPLVGTGTGEGNRVSLTFTPTAGTLTCTVSGTVTNAQLETGTVATSYIPTVASTVTKVIDNVTQGPVLSGVEMVSNGSDFVDTTGWTTSSSTLAAVSDELEVTTVGASGNGGYGVYAMTTVVGQTYTVTAENTVLAAGQNAFLRVGTSPSSPFAGLIVNKSRSSIGTLTGTYVATATTHYIYVGGNNPVGGEVYRFDDITNQQVVPFVGWNSAEGSIVIISTTKDIATDNRNLSFSDGTADEEMSSSAEAAAHFTVTDGGVVQANIDAGAYVNNVQSKLAAAYKVNDFAASLDGTTAVTDGAGTLPTITELHIGAQYDGAGAQINGHISRIVYYNVRLTDAQLETLST